LHRDVFGKQLKYLNELDSIEVAFGRSLYNGSIGLIRFSIVFGHWPPQEEVSWLKCSWPTNKVTRQVDPPPARRDPTIHRGARLGGHRRTLLTFPDTDRSANSGVVRYIT